MHSGVHRSSCLSVKKRNHRTWGWDGEHPWAEKAHVRSAVCAECSASWNLGCVTVTWQLPVAPVENKQPREWQWDSKASFKRNKRAAYGSCREVGGNGGKCVSGFECLGWVDGVGDLHIDTQWCISPRVSLSSPTSGSPVRLPDEGSRNIRN